jgi:hypothetical protein
MPIKKPLKIPTQATPLTRCYWVVDKLFLAGAYAGHVDPLKHVERVTGLWNAGMRTFVNLIEEDEKNPQGKSFTRYDDILRELATKNDERVAHLRFPIVDQHITSNDRMSSILDAIDLSIANQVPVYAHCFGGIGRTGTVVCCWLLRHGFVSKENVFQVLAQLREADIERSWRDAPENEMQKDFVLNWPTEPVQTKSKKTATVKLKDDWFTKLTGFSERSPAEVRENIAIQGNQLTSRVNGATYQCGKLDIVSLGALRQRIAEVDGRKGKLAISELVGDAKAIHADASNAGAVFQVASQFNLLEMVSPSITPEEGIGIYENDPTQGPACAIACGAGTIFRNYFVEIDGQIGQSGSRQVDCLSDVGEALGNVNQNLWKMQNGYALPTSKGLTEVVALLRKMTPSELDELRQKLKIGIHWDTQVTLHGGKHLVTQVYCSALPVAYSNLPSSSWEPFARLVLEAAYEAALAAGVLNATKTGNKTVYLTMLGGGAFGNDQDWILDAIRRACLSFQHKDLEVKIVSFRRSNPDVKKLALDITDEIQ